MPWPKINSYKEFDNEEKFLRLENSPPPHNFSNGPSLNKTLHVIDYRGAASPCYRISRRITVFMCEQKPYPLFRPHDRIYALQTKSGQKGMWIVSHELHVSILTNRRLQRWSVNGTLQCTSLQAYADSCQHYTLCYLQAVMSALFFRTRC